MHEYLIGFEKLNDDKQDYNDYTAHGLGDEMRTLQHEEYRLTMGQTRATKELDEDTGDAFKLSHI